MTLNLDYDVKVMSGRKMFPYNLLYLHSFKLLDGFHTFSSPVIDTQGVFEIRYSLMLNFFKLNTLYVVNFSEYP